MERFVELAAVNAIQLAIRERAVVVELVIAPTAAPCVLIITQLQ